MNFLEFKKHIDDISERYSESRLENLTVCVPIETVGVSPEYIFSPFLLYSLLDYKHWRSYNKSFQLLHLAQTHLHHYRLHLAHYILYTLFIILLNF